MLTCWGGKDDYQFKFEPSKMVHANGLNGDITSQKGIIITKDENDNNTVVSHEKKVGKSHVHTYIVSFPLNNAK